MSGYTYSIRLVIIVSMLITTHFALGTRFDNSAVTRFDAFGETFEVEARSWEQYLNLIIGPQLLLWHHPPRPEARQHDGGR